MKNKKSFLIHIDSLDILDDLTNEQCGELFKAIKSHHKNKKIELSQIVKIAFSPFKNQFNRDNEKYKKTCEARALAGSKGGKQKVANASKCKQKVANLADSDSKKDNDSDSDNDKYIEPLFLTFWLNYDKKINMDKCKNKFKRLSKRDRDKIFETLPNYIKSTPDKQYRKAPLVYLNNKSWNDEIIQRGHNESTKANSRHFETSTDRARRDGKELLTKQRAAQRRKTNTENHPLIQHNV